MSRSLQRPPTEIGASFTIRDLGTEDGGEAISAIRDAFRDCWEEKALVVEGASWNENTYSFQDGSPIYCCHVPDDGYESEMHGPQTMGFRYSYKFMRDLEANTEVRVVPWDDTQFTDVEEVLYP